MSSASDSDSSSTNGERSEDYLSASDEDIGAIKTQFLPYQDEPLAGDARNGNSSDEDNHFEENIDPDGLTADILASRYKGEVSVSNWCKCGQCNTASLVGAMEFRCCHEVGEAIGKLTFDASIEKIKRVTEHEDYIAHSNESVLVDVAPLLRDKNGRSYRRLAGQSRNEFLRAVSYRWLIRWLCGYMGWNNTRSLPSCIYNNIRSRYQTGDKVGFTSALERQ